MEKFLLQKDGLNEALFQSLKIVERKTFINPLNECLFKSNSKTPQIGGKVDFEQGLNFNKNAR